MESLLGFSISNAKAARGAADVLLDLKKSLAQKQSAAAAALLTEFVPASEIPPAVPAQFTIDMNVWGPPIDSRRKDTLVSCVRVEWLGVIEKDDCLVPAIRDGDKILAIDPRAVVSGMADTVFYHPHDAMLDPKFPVEAKTWLEANRSWPSLPYVCDNCGHSLSEHRSTKICTHVVSLAKVACLCPGFTAKLAIKPITIRKPTGFETAKLPPHRTATEALLVDPTTRAQLAGVLGVVQKDGLDPFSLPSFTSFHGLQALIETRQSMFSTDKGPEYSVMVDPFIVSVVSMARLAADEHEYRLSPALATMLMLSKINQRIVAATLRVPHGGVIVRAANVCSVQSDYGSHAVNGAIVTEWKDENTARRVSITPLFQMGDTSDSVLHVPCASWFVVLSPDRSLVKCVKDVEVSSPEMTMLANFVKPEERIQLTHLVVNALLYINSRGAELVKERAGEISALREQSNRHPKGSHKRERLLDKIRDIEKTTRVFLCGPSLKLRGLLAAPTMPSKKLVWGSWTEEPDDRLLWVPPTDPVSKKLSALEEAEAVEQARLAAAKQEAEHRDLKERAAIDARLKAELEDAKAAAAAEAQRQAKEKADEKARLLQERKATEQAERVAKAEKKQKEHQAKRAAQLAHQQAAAAKAAEAARLRALDEAQANAKAEKQKLVEAEAARKATAYADSIRRERLAEEAAEREIAESVTPIATLERRNAIATKPSLEPRPGPDHDSDSVEVAPDDGDTEDELDDDLWHDFINDWLTKHGPDKRLRTIVLAQLRNLPGDIRSLRTEHKRSIVLGQLLRHVAGATMVTERFGRVRLTASVPNGWTLERVGRSANPAQAKTVATPAPSQDVTQTTGKRRGLAGSLTDSVVDASYFVIPGTKPEQRVYFWNHDGTWLAVIRTMTERQIRDCPRRVWRTNESDKRKALLATLSYLGYPTTDVVEEGWEEGIL